MSPNSQSKYTLKHAVPAQRETAWRHQQNSGGRRGVQLTLKHARQAQRHSDQASPESLGRLIFAVMAATKFSMHECMNQTSWAYAKMGWEHFPRPATLAALHRDDDA